MAQSRYSRRLRPIANWYPEHFGDRVKHFCNDKWAMWCVAWDIGCRVPCTWYFLIAQLHLKVAHHTVIAHATAVNAMRAVRDDLKIGPVLNQANYPADDPTDPASSTRL
jgi:beta-glucosidase/6-phospho-beta-glucosidase/beta-galactosidase